MSNVTPIRGDIAQPPQPPAGPTKKPRRARRTPPKITKRIEEQRTRIFRVMAIVGVMRESFHRDADYDERETLAQIYDMLNDVGAGLELIAYDDGSEENPS
jgi:hypothetical protein